MDNLYPRSSEYIHNPPKEQVEEQEKEQSLVRKESEIIKRVIKKLDERIAFYLSIDSLPENTTSLKVTVEANKKVVKALREEKEGLELMIS